MSRFGHVETSQWIHITSTLHTHNLHVIHITSTFSMWICGHSTLYAHQPHVCNKVMEEKSLSLINIYIVKFSSKGFGGFRCGVPLFIVLLVVY